MGNELQEAQAEPKELTKAQVIARVRLIQEVMRDVMKEGVHYGMIPGVNKPTLLKAGSEVILTTFQVAVDPEVQDLSDGDCCRIRVIAKGVHIPTGKIVGGGVGEASSNEERYKWRKAVCEEEFNETPEDRRRVKWAKAYGKDPFQIKQVRMNIADVANTVLKMAKKRAQVDLTLTATAASDMFTQDVEDMPAEMLGEQRAKTAAPKGPEAAEETQAHPEDGGEIISDKQGKRLYAIWKGAGKKDDEVKKYLKEKYGLDGTRKIPVRLYDEIVAWAQTQAAEV